MNTIDITAATQAEAMKRLRDAEDRRFYWHIRVTEMASKVKGLDSLRAIYILVLKYGAKAKCTPRGHNIYEIELECIPATHGDYAFTYKIGPRTRLCSQTV